jgi:hypothetical protein
MKRMVPEMGEAPQELRGFEPPFDFDVKSAAGFGELLSGGDLKKIDESDLGRIALHVGRLLLIGDGGSGKTTLVGRLWRKAKVEGSFACWVDLRRWSNSLTNEWEASNEYSWGAEMLLSRLATPATSEQEFELSTLPSILLLIDGVNEVPRQIGERILQTADYLAARHPNIGIIATDRLVRRDSVDARWSLARITAAHSSELQSDDPMLMNAFFLNLTIQKGLAARTASGAFQEYLQDHVSLSLEEVRQTAKASASAYINDQSRFFQLGPFEEIAGKDVVRRLSQAGQLLQDGSCAYFAHQLIHDALAADWLAVTPSLWSKDGFDPLTFRASSFDVLALTLERIPNPSNVDAFIRKIYDWNYYGAAFTLARAQALGEVDVSETMRIALLAMLAERQWDPMVATAEQVKDALRMIGDEMAHLMLSAESPEEIHKFVSDLDAEDPSFEEWRRIYLRDFGVSADDELLMAIRDEDSLIGWTAANVLRRTQPTNEALDQMIELCRGADSDVIRWRAAHVLGGWPNSSSAQALQDAFVMDSDDWVRYGATRSLIDVAARDGGLREDIILWISGHLPERSELVVGEIERSLVRHPAPPNWTEDVSVIVEGLFASADDERERDRWRRLATRLREVSESQKNE